MSCSLARQGLWLLGLFGLVGCYEPNFPEVAGEGCEGAAAALADEIYAAPQGCTAVLDLGSDFGIRQWALVCGAEDAVALEESQARRLTECCESDGTAVNPPMPDDAFVFFETDADANGTIAVVSRHTAARVYEATLNAGEADVVFPRPESWRGPDVLADDCEPDPIVNVSSYDESGDAPPVAVLEAISRAETTGLVDAMRSGDGELIWTVVLRAGAGDPGTGGWVALLQSDSQKIDFTGG